MPKPRTADPRKGAQQSGCRSLVGAPPTVQHAQGLLQQVPVAAQGAGRGEAAAAGAPGGAQVGAGATSVWSRSMGCRRRATERPPEGEAALVEPLFWPPVDVGVPPCCCPEPSRLPPRLLRRLLDEEEGAPPGPYYCPEPPEVGCVVGAGRGADVADAAVEATRAVGEDVA